MTKNPINFLLIGAQKSGTSWLAEMLGQHPEVFRSEKKELDFFHRTSNYQKGLDWYLRHFEGADGKKAIGECSPNYLWVCDGPEELHRERQRAGKPRLDFVIYENRLRNTPELVHANFPNLKLLVSLRNPVDRAISSFFHSMRAGRIPPHANILDVGVQWGILGMGFYYRQLLAWNELFPRESFLILIYEEDIKKKKDETLRRVFRHLDVDDSFVPQGAERVVNKSTSGPLLRAKYYAPNIAGKVFKLIPQLNNLHFLDIKVSDSDRAELAEIYRSENARLEEYIGRSLECWHD